jgi:hypothetical protein
MGKPSRPASGFSGRKVISLSESVWKKCDGSPIVFLANDHDLGITNRYDNFSLLFPQSSGSSFPHASGGNPEVSDELICPWILRRYQTLGYVSDDSACAAEALDVLGRDHFDLVVSDIVMEDKDGLQNMPEALGKYPHLRFMLRTGHAADYTFSDLSQQKKGE